MKVCVKCGKVQQPKQTCSRCGSDVLIDVKAAQAFFGPRWKQMFEEDASVEPEPVKPIRVSVSLPDGEFSTTWHSTGVQKGV